MGRESRRLRRRWPPHTSETLDVIIDGNVIASTHSNRKLPQLGDLGGRPGHSQA